VNHHWLEELNGERKEDMSSIGFKPFDMDLASLSFSQYDNLDAMAPGMYWPC
jgi:hypothetical protein